MVLITTPVMGRLWKGFGVSWGGGGDEGALGCPIFRVPLGEGLTGYATWWLMLIPEGDSEGFLGLLPSSIRNGMSRVVAVEAVKRGETWFRGGRVGRGRRRFGPAKRVSSTTTAQAVHYFISLSKAPL